MAGWSRLLGRMRSVEASGDLPPPAIRSLTATVSGFDAAEALSTTRRSGRAQAFMEVDRPARLVIRAPRAGSALPHRRQAQGPSTQPPLRE
jgi:hypothetical protein